MKRIILATLLTLITSSQAIAMQDGLYIGLGGGLYGYGTDVEASDNDPPATTLKVEGTNSNITGSLMFGYSFPVSDRWSLALEIDGELNGGQSKPFDYSITNGGNTSTASLTEKNRYAVGIALVPYWLMTPNNSLLFKLAYKRGRFETTATETAPQTTTSTNKSWRNGLELGVGTQLTMMQNWDLRLSASHTFYDKETVFSSDPNATSQASVNKALLTVIWHSDWI